ncbi:uncharacterized protein LOC102154731 isoform X1 [Canis lupus familiaris]|uniref:uncharacterized protein LOC102154731 isoform X1 n=1 Tax=Canis lupus familiaris TaxID=9615 RepID=UPI0018F33160|nr:uncharacterized protein LOC102154731 isoform X1 [Canis lupus familiaris]XP_038308959.1 uncharacterized protein LOC102154731 isoform X1 [Canis lupus familiaris]
MVKYTVDRGAGTRVRAPGSAWQCFWKAGAGVRETRGLLLFLLTLNRLPAVRNSSLGSRQHFRSTLQTLASCSPNPYLPSGWGRTGKMDEKTNAQKAGASPRACPFNVETSPISLTWDVEVTAEQKNGR